MIIRPILMPLTAAACLAAVFPALGQDAIPISEVAHIHGVAFHPEQAGHILLATHFGLFDASDDGMARQISTTFDDFMGFTPAPDGSGKLFASGHPELGGNLGFIVSQNGGVTWNHVSDGASGPVDFHAMTVSRADPDRLYGYFKGIQVSTDGGKTWTVAGPGPDQVIDLAASASDADSLYAGTINGLHVSLDGGRSWRLQGPPGVPVTMVETSPDGAVYAYFAGNGLFGAPAEDGQWSEIWKGGDDIFHLAADPRDARHLVAVTSESEVLESRDGGQSWQPFGK